METFQLARTHVEQMRMDVCLRLPEEACGLLGGRQNRAEIVLPVTNSLHSSTRFFLDPEEMITAILQLESRGMDVVGIYHSHPAGPAGQLTTFIFKRPVEGAAKSQDEAAA